eukprot:COSAG02_NODE_51802_length_311_cov_20.122642_1_plen_47_part_10
MAWFGAPYWLCGSLPGLYGAALGGSYLVQAAVQGATHHTPRPPRITT